MLQWSISLAKFERDHANVYDWLKKIVFVLPVFSWQPIYRHKDTLINLLNQIYIHNENHGHFTALIIDRNTCVGCVLLFAIASGSSIFIRLQCYALDTLLYEEGYPGINFKRVAILTIE